MSIIGIWWLMRQTNWTHFLSKNGVGEVKWKKSSGWREQPNNMARFFTIHGQIVGGPRGDGLYAAWIAEDTDNPKLMALGESTVNSHFETYAHPDCRCRMGLHWKCGIHKKWRG